MHLTKNIVSILKSFNLIGSEIMKLYLRINGAEIGKNVYISFSSRLVSKKLKIAKDSIILQKVKIKAGSINIGKSCILSSDIFISGTHKIEIGNKTYLGKKVRIDLNRDVVIGEDVGLGENSVIWTHGYFPPADEGYPITYAPVTIKDKAWVSTNIIILPGITIGKKVIIGAGSVITKSIEDGKIAAGNPAKVIKSTDDILIKKGFTTIMSEILDGFLSGNLIKKENKLNQILYVFHKFEILITEEDSHTRINDTSKFLIIISKHSKPLLSSLNGKMCFLDFETKEMYRTRNPFVIELKAYLVGFGIRFSYID